MGQVLSCWQMGRAGHLYKGTFTNDVSYFGTLFQDQPPPPPYDYFEQISLYSDVWSGSDLVTEAKDGHAPSLPVT